MRNRWLSTRAAAHSMRVNRLSFDISSENTATVCLFFSATCCAMFNASAVFPIEGRPAMMNKSPPCMPPVYSSSFRNPVLTPLTRLLGSRNALIPPSYPFRISSGFSKPLFTWASPSFSSVSSAPASISSGVSSAIIARFRMCSDAKMMLRSVALSFTSRM